MKSKHYYEIVLLHVTLLLDLDGKFLKSYKI
jgi:hypothetical protein